MATDGTVGLAPDSTGKKVDTSELTVGAVTVERQRVVCADPSNASGLAPVSAQFGMGVNDAQNGDVLSLILIELRTITYYLQAGLNVKDDPAMVRSDPTLLN